MAATFFLNLFLKFLKSLNRHGFRVNRHFSVINQRECEGMSLNPTKSFSNLCLFNVKNGGDFFFLNLFLKFLKSLNRQGFRVNRHSANKN